MTPEKWAEILRDLANEKDAPPSSMDLYDEPHVIASIYSDTESVWYGPGFHAVRVKSPEGRAAAAKARSERDEQPSRALPMPIAPVPRQRHP